METASTIVPEVLKKDNYRRWRILMQHYFEAHDLWNVVISKEIPCGVDEREWTKKNAAALLALKVLCEAEVFDKVEEMNSAKEVWDALADMHKPPPVPHEIPQLQEHVSHAHEIEIIHHSKDVSQESEVAEPRAGPEINLATEQFEIFRDLLNKGNERELLEFCRQNPAAGSARVFENGSTALHFAITIGRQGIARDLIFNAREEDLEIQDNDENTPLSLAIRYGRMRVVHLLTRIAKDSLLLKPAGADKRIPVQLACDTGHEHLTRYLYRRTRSLVQEEDICFNLLKECITKKMFDIAFDLLQQFPDLANPQRCLNPGSIPIILTLAQTPPPFFRGSQLIFWKRWIYNGTRVKADSIKQIQDEKFFFEGYDNHSMLIILVFACCPYMLLPLIWEWISDAWEPNIPQHFIQQSLARARKIVQQSLACARKIVQQSLACVRRVTHLSCDEFRGTPKGGLLEMLKMLFGFIKVLLLELSLVPFIIVTVVVALGPISMRCLILGRKVSVPALDKDFECTFIADVLSKLVSLFSWAFARQVYDLKTMDEYAREVISSICKPLSNLNQKQFEQSRAVEATFQAIKNGIPEILNEITKAHANILWSNTDPESSRNMFAYAVAHRQEKVAQIIYESLDTNLVLPTNEDDDGNNALHLAAQLAPHSQLGRIPGAALQLQSEVRWFKSVECIVPQFWKEHKNKEGGTPSQVFAEEHKNLLEEAEEWIKKTAESSTVVGALIITIMFAAAFTVPGGNDQDTGYPIFLSQKPIPFMVFIVSDAVSLFTASNSVLMFLGILTSRYAYDDFLKSLPIKLIIGLSSLFISIATMTTAFCATLFIMLHGRLEVIIPITLLACIPIAFFGWLQFPLLVEIYTSTFRRNIFEKEKKSFLESWLNFFCEITFELWM